MDTTSPLARQRRLILDTLLLGVVGALGAQVFTLPLRLANWLFLTVLAGYTPPGLEHEGGSPAGVIGPHGLWLIPVATTIGGLISATALTLILLPILYERFGTEGGET